MNVHVAIYLLTSVLIGVNGPFTFTERFEKLEECIRAKVYYASQEQWAGRCRRVSQPMETFDDERGRA